MRTGRPTSLTEGVHEAIVRALTAGSARKHAAESAGISYASFKRWMVRGRNEEEPYASLSDAVTRAEAEAVIRNVAIIQRAAATSWQAAAWWLERTKPETYSRDQVLIRQLERQIRDLERRLSEQGK